MSTIDPRISTPPADSAPRHGFWATIWAMLRQRCPRCRTGCLFRGRFAMNDPCSVCGLVFQREEGYFLGAMYVSSVLSMTAITPIYFSLVFLLPQWDRMILAALAFALYLPLTPAVFRYSRTGWIYLDRTVCSGPVSAGSYEKVRLKQVADTRTAPPPGT